MAATGFTPISLYYTTTALAVPSSANLVAGELALNTTDGILYFKNTAGTVTLLSTTAPLTGAITSVGQVTSLGSFTSAQLAGALTNETGSGSAVFATSPTLVTPILGTPTSGIATNLTGLPLTTGVTGTLPVLNGGTGVTTSTGSGNVVLSTSPTLVTPILGTPTSGTATNLTGLPLTTGVTGTLPVLNGGTGVTTSTGSGNVVLSTSPTLVTPILGTPTSGTATNLTGLPLTTGVTGTLPIANGGTAGATAIAALVSLGVKTSATGSEIIPFGTTAQRDASPVAGYLRYNTTINSTEVYSGTAWGSVGGGATGAGGDTVFVQNSQAVTTSYTITAGQNASSVGPITIPGGVIITVPTGARWVIL